MFIVCYFDQAGGKDIPVTSANVEDYIHEVIDATIGKGVALQAKAFRDGFSKVFPVSDLQAFSADELEIVFGSAEEDWGLESELDFMPSIGDWVTKVFRSVGRSFESRPWLQYRESDHP